MHPLSGTNCLLTFVLALLFPPSAASLKHIFSHNRFKTVLRLSSDHRTGTVLDLIFLFRHISFKPFWVYRFAVIYAAGTSLTSSLDEEKDVKPLLLLLLLLILL